MAITYTEMTNSVGQTIILRDNGDGTTSTIPADLGNSDYQAYLDRDKPKAALSTPSLPE